ncbi:MAG: hypothetical protein NXI22_19015 [bacterium]|nr:hypothetical protein [bacterium]
MYSDYEPVDVAFINGYLAPLSLLMDYVTHEVGFTYYFHELTVAEDSSILDSVRNQIRESIISFHEANRRQLDIRRINNILESECRLKPLSDWHNSIKARLSSWVAQPLIDGLQKIAQRDVWPSTLLVDDFTNVLQGFFGTQATECFTLEGEIKSELHIHWGVSFDDFFFETAGRQYHLHFDLCD